MTAQPLQVRPAQLAQWRADTASSQHARAVLLDVREPWEVALAPVTPDGFSRLTIPMGQLAQQLAQLDPTQPVACLCHHGVRSQRVALFLLQNGFQQVANIAGGIDAWSRELDNSIALY